MNDNIAMKRIRIHNDIRVRHDNSMDFTAWIIIPTLVKDIGGEVGVIIGNDGYDQMLGPKLSFSVSEGGKLKLKLETNETGITISGRTGKKICLTLENFCWLPREFLFE